jgi:mannose-6-phosphate isomerase-like protein (cupin superfamily)
MSELPAYSAADVAAHSTRDDLWVIIQGKGTITRYLGRLTTDMSVQSIMSPNMYETIREAQMC